MKKLNAHLIALICLFNCNWLYATDIHAIARASLGNSQQLLLVSTPDINTVSGYMQRYQRNSPKAHWSKVGAPIAVVVGKNGLALGVTTPRHSSADTTPSKKEGDLRTPIGVFALGPAFGFSTTPDISIKLDYLPLSANSFCVDDQTSSHYNRIIDSGQVHKDWRSGEQMRETAQYRLGAVIQYNQTKPVPGAGSCIFLHLWSDDHSGTSGCVATSETNLRTILSWLDPKKQPLIAILADHYPAE